MPRTFEKSIRKILKFWENCEVDLEYFCGDTKEISKKNLKNWRRTSKLLRFAEI